MIALFSLFLACSEEPAPDQPKTCCTVDEVQEMCTSGVSEALILSTLETAEETPELGAQDVIALSSAGCPDAVIAALQGTELPVEEEAQEEEAAATTSGKPQSKKAEEEIPFLAMQVVQGSMMIDVKNTSKSQYSNLTLTVNGQYSYKLAKLDAWDTDSIRKGSFKDSNGTKFNGAIQKIYIRADQGHFSQSF
jgi:hypothetical protein